MSETATQTQVAMPDKVVTLPAPVTPRRLKDILCLDDFEAPARRHLPRPIFGYISGGVETNASLVANRAAFANGHVICLDANVDELLG